MNARDFRALGAFSLLFSLSSAATWEYPGCSPVDDSHFRIVHVVEKIGNHPELNEPIEMAFDARYDADSNVLADIYWAERPGYIKRYDAVSGDITTLAHMDVLWEQSAHGGNVEDGLVGIALDPDFKENGWLYVFYTTPKPDPCFFRISRLTVEDNSIDLSTERVLIDILTQQLDCCHTGGAMAFDPKGDLWIATGNNTHNDGGFINEGEKHKSDEWGSTSTAGLKGSVLRIHPDDSAPKGYTIPEGNFWDYYAAWFDSLGNTELAAQYRDSSMVKREIYAKGYRNPYTLTVDPIKGWVTIGDCGPDRGWVTEEHDLMVRPGFYGWPYFAGDNISFVGDKDPDAPLNTSVWNEGVEQLPPAIPAVYPYQQACAMSGPIYNYFPDIKSPVKWPPHFHRKWLVGDFDWQTFWAASLSEDGLTLLGQPVQMLKDEIFQKLMEIEQGPDGAIYINRYAGWFNSTVNTAIDRIEYVGPDCTPDPSDFPSAVKTFARKGPAASFRGASIAVNAAGPYSVRVSNIRGRTIRTDKGIGPDTYMLDNLGKGMFFVTVATPRGRVSEKVVRF